MWEVRAGCEGLACEGRGPSRGQVAVPVGGGRAPAGHQIDHTEPTGSRVAI